MLSYRQLQSALKNYRQAGHQLQVKLTANQAALQAEYNRISQESNETIESNTELEQLRLELECARAIIKGQQQRIEELEQQLQQPVEAKVETKVEEQEPEIEAKQVLEVIKKYNSFASFPEIGRELNLTPKQLHQLMFKLEKADIIEMAKVAEPQDYSAEELETWGIPEFSGGALFFAIPA